MQDKIYSAKLINSSVRVYGTYEATSIWDGKEYYEIHLLLDRKNSELAYEIDKETLVEVSEDGSKCA